MGVARDNKARPAFVPEAALRRQREKLEAKMENGEDEEEETMVPKRKTEREIELEEGDDYIIDLKKNFDLPEDQKYDIIPETWQGHNIADFIDPDIMEKLKELAGKIRHKKALLKTDQYIDNTRKP